MLTCSRTHANLSKQATRDFALLWMKSTVQIKQNRYKRRKTSQRNWDRSVWALISKQRIEWFTGDAPPMAGKSRPGVRARIQHGTAQSHNESQLSLRETQSLRGVQYLLRLGCCQSRQPWCRTTTSEQKKKSIEKWWSKWPFSDTQDSHSWLKTSSR